MIKNRENPQKKAALHRQYPHYGWYYGIKYTYQTYIVKSPDKLYSINVL